MIENGILKLEQIKEYCKNEKLSEYIANCLFNKKWVNAPNDDECFLYVHISPENENRISLYDSNKNTFLMVGDFGTVNTLSGKDYLRNEKDFLQLLQKIQQLESIEYLVECPI